MAVITGGHSALGNIQVKEVLYTYPNGVYIAKIEVFDNEENHFVDKTNNNGITSMFPKSWTADRIKVEINSAYLNRQPHSNEIRAQEGMWEGITSSGVKIEGYSYPRVTAFPSYEQE